jgi:signal transduction histidine kinase
VTLVCLLDAVRRWVWALYDAAPWRLLTGLLESFAFALIMMWLMMLAAIATFNGVSSSRRRGMALAAAVTLAGAVGVAIMLTVEPVNTFNGWNDRGGLLWRFELGWPRYALLGGMLAAAFVYFRAADQSARTAHQVELERTLLEQQFDQARLSTLEAQIEPHFLFNTLATVSRLYETDSRLAESMLDSLMNYLAIALPQMRATESTLGHELAHADAYLSIQQIRMGRRLRYALDVPPDLAAACLPPMILVTLVENSIKHGLNPLPEGGSVRIEARVEGGALKLVVADSGKGFARTSGGGTGLANIRERLASMHGESAQLSIGSNHPKGAIVTIVVPLASAAEARTAA